MKRRNVGGILMEQGEFLTRNVGFFCCSAPSPQFRMSGSCSFICLSVAPGSSSSFPGWPFSADVDQPAQAEEGPKCTHFTITRSEVSEAGPGCEGVQGSSLSRQVRSIGSFPVYSFLLISPITVCSLRKERRHKTSEFPRA